VNYYPHHIGDYLRDTSHLSLLEHGAYRRMLDLYYASEKPLPLNVDGLYRLVQAKSKQEKEAVDAILEEFFSRTDSGWRNSRADAEIAKAQEKGMKAKASAGVRWQSERNANAMRTHSEGNARPECEGNAPNNQEPITKDKSNIGPKPDHYHDQAVSVLAFLNEQAGRDYRPVDANVRLIAARLREGASVEDCCSVIDRKCREWKGGDMDQFLRPKTLFNATNFAQYQGEGNSASRFKVDA
jgi:uncharacterized phage protein (TIGR02220 family)